MSSPRAVLAFRGRLVRLAAVPLLGFALVLSAAAPAAAADSAMVRVLHASYNAPAVDVYVDGTKALSNVAFKGISTYLSVPAGNHTLAIRVAGTATDVISTTATVEAGKHYTVAAIDPLASIKFAVFADDAQPTAGAAQLRVVHLSPDAPAVDVAAAGQPASGAAVKNLAYSKASGYLSLPGGTYHFEVRPTGTTTVALDLPNVALANATSYTVFAVGSAAAEAPAGQKLTVVVATDAMVPPPTSTTNPSQTPAIPWYLAAIVALAAVVGGGYAARRFATSRARQ